MTIFLLKNDGERSRIFYFEILHAPSEIPANLPGKFILGGVRHNHGHSNAQVISPYASHNGTKKISSSNQLTISQNIFDCHFGNEVRNANGPIFII